jgi:hypothetical protein
MTDTLARMRQILGTTAEWAANDLTLGDGELAAEHLADGTFSLRLGDGSSRFSQLPPLGAVASTVIIGDGVTDRTAAIYAANQAGKPITISGIAHVAGPITITVPITDTRAQIFTYASDVRIDNGQAVRPEWFGPVNGRAGLVRRAVDAQVKGVIALSVAIYLSGYDTATAAMFQNRGGTPGLDYMVKPNIKIQGAQLPRYADDNSALINGSVIQGTLYVSSECHGFGLDEVGIDAGSAVCASLYGGADHDGCCFLQCNKLTPIYGHGITIGRVRGLCSGDSSQAHACLFEAIDGGSIGNAEGRYALHGVAIKSMHLVCGTLSGSLNHGEDIIFKSDDYANLASVEVDKCFCQGRTAGDAGYGVYILASAASGGTVSIGQIVAERKAIGLGMSANASLALADLNVGELITQSCPTGWSLGGAGLARIHVGRALINATTNGVLVDVSVTARTVGVGSLSVNSATRGIDASGKLRVGTLYVDNASAFALYHRSAAARVFLDGGAQIDRSVFWAADPALINSWVNLAGGSAPFSLTLNAGRVVMGGRIKAGTAATICNVATLLAPAAALSFPCVAYNGSVYAIVEVAISAAGAVTVSSFAAASSYLSLEGISWPIPF